VIVLDGDTFKLYYSWAQWQLGGISEDDWRAEVCRSRELFVSGGYGLADVVVPLFLYAPVSGERPSFAVGNSGRIWRAKPVAASDRPRGSVALAVGSISFGC
jgi:hypothetical protein